VEESDEDKPSIILGYDKDGNIVGIEILNASKSVLKKVLNASFPSCPQPLAPAKAGGNPVSY
jgi:uncharacterized protein YuzE